MQALRSRIASHSTGGTRRFVYPASWATAPQQYQQIARVRLLSTASPQDPDAPILLKIEGPKATITLNNAKVGNALDVTLQHSLTDHFVQLAKNPDVRAVVLTGVGKYFCTGLNLGSKGETLNGNNEEQHDRLKQMFETISNYPKPVIAVINGPCYGGGNGLAMVCDFRIASNPGVTFTLSEVKLGVAPSVISKYLVREWGPGKTRDAMLTGRPVTSHELLPIAGVHHIAETQKTALEYAETLVKQLVGSAPGAMHTVKQLISTMATQEEAAQDAIIREKFLEMMEPSKEAEYGINMFRKKLKPDWSTLQEK